MFKFRWKEVCLFLFKRVFILYLAFGALVFWITDVDKALFRTNLAVLNRLRPETFNYLVENVDLGQEYSKKELEKYLFYYKKVSEVVPDQAEAFGLSGYCLYYRGDVSKAIEAYLKAIEVNPKFFWFYHNLGVIYFNQGDYQKALENFQKAREAQIDAAIVFIAHSPRLYLPLKLIKSHGESPQAVIREEFEKGYQQLYLGSILAQKEIESSVQHPAPPQKQLRLFLY